MANLINAVGMDSTTGQFIIADPTDTLAAPALSGNSGTPSLAAGAALGTSPPTPTIIGTNLAGQITFTTATLSVVSGTVVTMTLANGLTFPTGCFVTFSAGNAAFASVIATISAVSTTTTVVLSVAVGLGINTTYIGYYQVVGY